jgi:IS5 family transposase
MMDGIVPWQTLTALTEPWYFSGARGTVIDATVIEAPSSAKNSTKSRDPETRSAKKGNQRHFGMKAHSVVATAANAADIEKAGELIRKDDDVAYGDNGYQGLENRPEIQASGAECRINKKKGADRKREKEVCGNPMGHLEYTGEPNWDHMTEG